MRNMPAKKEMPAHRIREINAIYEGIYRAHIDGLLSKPKLLEIDWAWITKQLVLHGYSLGERAFLARRSEPLDRRSWREKREVPRKFDTGGEVEKELEAEVNRPRRAFDRQTFYGRAGDIASTSPKILSAIIREAGKKPQAPRQLKELQGAVHQHLRTVFIRSAETGFLHGVLLAARR